MSKPHHPPPLPTPPPPVPPVAKIRTDLHSAIALHQRGRLIEAEPLYRNILRAVPHHFDALHLLGVLRHQQGRQAEALVLIDAALRQRPHEAVALANRGAVCNALGRFEDTLASCEHAIARKPDHAEAFNNRGLALKELKRLPEALASFERALALKPDYAEALNNRGIALHALGRSHDALASYERALALRPGYADAFNNRGIALYELKRHDEALASFDQAIALKPDYAHAHWNRAQLWLLTGDFERGWPEHEWRRPSNAALRRDFSQPAWRGEDAIASKTILLHGEQGLGDTIQFCRYVPRVAARGARVILQVQEPLRALLGDLAGVSALIGPDDPVPACDLQCSLLSLPLAFQTRLDTIPAQTPYLHAPAHALQDWAARLGPKRRARIGLVWSGNAGHKRDRDRSIALETLLPLLDLDADFVSLQKDLRPADAAVLAERPDIVNFTDALVDFCDTAALVAQLDLVIAVDTSVAHLAGALSTPLWLLLPDVPDWRWLLDRDDSPWYPSARLFRQRQPRDWDDVIARLRQAALAFLARAPNV